MPPGAVPQRAPCARLAGARGSASGLCPAASRPRAAPCRASGSSGGGGASGGGSGGGDDLEAREAARKAALEDELRDAASPLDFIFPRAVRRTALAALAGGAALSLGLGLQRAAEAPALEAATGGAGGLAVNAAVLAAAAALLIAESTGEDARRESRAAGRERQESAGEREEAALPDGTNYSRLKQVDDKWIVKRLERWGAQDNLPFVGSAKGDVLQSLIREKKPRAVLEIGTALGYSSIRMAQALADDGCSVVTVDRDLTCVLSARRFLWQCNQGERAPGEPRIGRRVRVEWGDAAAVVPRLQQAGRRFDFLFVDGTPSDTLALTRLCEPLLLPGATVVANNTRVFEKSLQPHLAYVRGDAQRYAASEARDAPFGWRGDAPDALEVSTWRGDN